MTIYSEESAKKFSSSDGLRFYRKIENVTNEAEGNVTEKANRAAKNGKKKEERFWQGRSFDKDGR